MLSAHGLAGGTEQWSLFTAGALLFGSANPAYLPGGIEVKRAEVWRRALSPQEVKA